MKVYGAPICSDCVYSEKVLKKMNVQYKNINIIESISNMKEFLKLRDARSEFDSIKERGKVGIPAFVFTDGRIEFDINNITAEEINEDFEKEVDNDDKPGLCGFDGC